MASENVAEEDADQIVASYDIYIKPHLKDGKKVYILQFPNRDSRQNYSSANSSLPLELRMKEKSGLVELDVPMDTFRNYDREKGVRWGEAVRKSENTKQGGGGSHGLGGGFGIGGAQGARPRGAQNDDNEEMNMQEALMRDFARSVDQGRVLSKQTLGGQAIPRDRTTPQYMIGAFRNRGCTLGMITSRIGEADFPGIFRAASSHAC
jgi:DNA-directed RNA polymerase-3 subunit RPC5